MEPLVRSGIRETIPVRLRMAERIVRYQLCNNDVCRIVELTAEAGIRTADLVRGYTKRYRSRDATDSRSLLSPVMCIVLQHRDQRGR